MIFGRTVKGKRDYYGNQYTFNGTDRRTVSYDSDGIYYCKDRIVKGDDSKVISKIVLYLVIPCVIINAFQVDYTSEKVKELLLVFAASVLLQVILLAAVWGVGKVLKLNEVEMTSIYYSNSGNLIVPLVTFILGKEWVLYGCVFMSVQLVFLWTHGKNTISREGKWDWKKIVFNINMISVFAGVVLFLPGSGFRKL